MRSDNILKQKYWFSVSPFRFNLIYAAAMLLIYNPLFFRKFYEVSPSAMFFVGGLFCMLLLLNVAANILLFRPIAKCVAILLLLINAAVYYFMITYNISIDKVMLLNLLETDWNEAKETFSYSILAYVAFLGILPSILVYKTEILSRNWVSELCRRSLTIVLSLMLVAGLVFANFKTTAQFMRNNKPLKYLLIPVNYFGAVISLTKIKLTEVKGPLEVVADDAFMIRYWDNPSKKNLLVIVVGETARAQNWGLNGYEVDTTAPLNQYKNEIFNFTDVKACGTSTEISLPCMFALEGQHDFNRWKAKRRENLLDVAKAVQDPGCADDIILREGDRIFVPKYIGTVSISGAVLYQNTVVYDQKKFKEYIRQAGGYKKEARRRPFVVYMNGKVAATRGALFFKRYPKVEAGCQIIVPMKPERTGNGLVNTMGFMSSTASLAAMVASIINLSK